MFNAELMDEKIEKLEKLIIPNKGPMDNLSGDIGTEEIETFLKAMSNGGSRDAEIAKAFASWLTDNKVTFTNFDTRKFKINTVEFAEALNKNF